MKETIIKGTGNSRSIRSVPNFATLYPTWESYRDAMAADGVPVDIGALNPDGCRQIGDALNKENLLKDSTAALYGLPGEAVVDEVLERAQESISGLTIKTNQKADCQYGTYVGVGSAEKTLTFPFLPKVLMIVQTDHSNGSFALYVRGAMGMFLYSVAYNGYSQSHNNQRGIPVTLSGNSILWKSDNAVYAMNYSGYKYTYFCAG